MSNITVALKAPPESWYGLFIPERRNLLFFRANIIRVTEIGTLEMLDLSGRVQHAFASGEWSGITRLSDKQHEVAVRRRREDMDFDQEESEQDGSGE